MRAALQVLRSACIALALLSTLGARPAQAQSLALSSSRVEFPTAGVSHLNAGVVESGATTIMIDPGGPVIPWTLHLRASALSLNPAGKPLSDLLWRLHGSNLWTAVAVTDQALASGVGPATLQVYLRTRLGWATDGPGTFGTDVVFSLTTLPASPLP